MAVLAVLMLRGDQTPGELKQRTERMHAFADLGAVEATLEALGERGLVARLERRPGQKEERYAHRLSEDLEDLPPGPGQAVSPPAERVGSPPVPAPAARAGARAGRAAGAGRRPDGRPDAPRRREARLDRLAARWRAARGAGGAARGSRRAARRARRLASARLDAHGRRELAAERVLLGPDAHGQRAAERLAVEQRQRTPGTMSRSARWRSIAGSASETRTKHTVSPTSTSSSARVSCSGTARSRLGIGSPWGSTSGLPELRRDPLRELVGEHVLEQLGLLVDEVPRHVEHLDEQELEQPVVAERAQRDAAALGGEPDPAVALVLEQAELGEAAQHARHGAGRDPEPLGERVGRTGPSRRVSRA